MSLQFEAGVRTISLIFLIALTSCTTWAPPDPSSWHWRKEGGTVEQQRRDQAECATASDRAYNAATGDTAVRAAAAKPGRRGLLSGEGLLLAGALILVLARSWSVHRRSPSPHQRRRSHAYGEDRAGAHRRESRFRGFKRCACQTAAARGAVGRHGERLRRSTCVSATQRHHRSPVFARLHVASPLIGLPMRSRAASDDR
jgi:hypothetical protein